MNSSGSNEPSPSADEDHEMGLKAIEKWNLSQYFYVNYFFFNIFIIFIVTQLK